jgi:hypothetical protein
MFFGISMIAILMSIITNTFYKRRYEKEEREKREEQLNYLKNELLKRLSEIETFRNRAKTGKMHRPYQSLEIILEPNLR